MGFLDFLSSGRLRRESQIERTYRQLVQAQIDHEYGAGGAFTPRKPLYSRYWVRGRLVEEPSPFNGLPLLKRTKTLYNSIRARLRRTGSGWEMIVSGVDYAIYHDNGFKTQGPNFIPLTPRGASRRGKSGRDYFIAKKGVTVPSRPFLNLTPNHINQLSAVLVQDIAEKAVQKMVVEKIRHQGVRWDRKYK